MDLSIPTRSLYRQSIRAIARSRPAAPCRRCISISASQSATPIAHPTTPGPPPEPPAPAVSDAQDRVARKLRQAELLRRGQSLRANPAKPSSALQKRFWKDVTVTETPDGLQVMLDTRPVRTASKEILTLPRSKHALALAIALEWDQLVSAQQALKHHYIPLTSLAARAVDIQRADAAGNAAVRNDILAMLMRYLSTDTLLCWAPEKNIHDAPPAPGTESLRAMQQRIAEPILAYLTTRVWPGVAIAPILDPDSIMPVEQSAATKSVIRGWLGARSAWELAGLERAVLASKSLLVGARLVEEWSEETARGSEAATTTTQSSGGDIEATPSRFGIEQAAEAASLEVRWQTNMWGEVEDTHDVEREDLLRQLGSVVLLVNGSSAA